MLGQVLAEYRDSVRLVYKDFPLPFHAGAFPAALAARCAGAQERYWEYHDLLFLGQPDFSRDHLLGYAKRLKLDMQAFTACLDGLTFRDAVSADMREGETAGVKATPTFFVNGEKVEGAQSIEVFREAVEEALREAGGRRQ